MSSRSRPTHSRFWNRCGVPDAVETASWVIFKHPREHDDWGRSPLRSLRFLVSVVAAATLLFASLTPPLVGAAQAPPGSLAFSAAGDYGHGVDSAKAWPSSQRRNQTSCSPWGI